MRTPASIFNRFRRFRPHNKMAASISKASATSFVLGFHAVFFLIASIALYPCIDSLIQAKDNAGSQCRISHTVTALTVGWNLSFAVITNRLGHDRLFSFWRFVAILSVFQVLPDWFLVKLGTLTFPDDYVWKFAGAVSWYMAGMWSIPLLWILCICSHDKKPSKKDYYRSAFMSVLIFGAAEQLCYPLQIWQVTEQVAHKVGNVALYILPGEALLGPAVLYAYHATLDCSWNRQVFAASMISVWYTGAVAVGHLLVEKQMWHG
jgi:hypothetical protein